MSEFVAAVDSQVVSSLRDRDLLRVLVALAGRIAFPPDRLLAIVGPYAAAYNMCTGEATLASVARAAGIDKSNLRKAVLRWEQAGVLFRVGAQGLPLALYSLPIPEEAGRGKGRTRTRTGDSPQSPEGEVDGDEEH